MFSLDKKLFLLLVLLSNLYLHAEIFDRVGKSEPAFFTYKPIYFGTTIVNGDGTESGESHYQFSFKYEIFNESSWFFAYTERSVWSTQLDSGPIKETNYAPELFYAWHRDQNTVPYVQFGLYKHVSNGESGATSLQWDISYIEPVIKFEEFTLKLTFWFPFLFQSASAVSDGNPAIFEFYGQGEMKLSYEHENGDLHTLRYRENINFTAFALEYQWTINLNSSIDENGWNTNVYLQFFNGFGETLNSYSEQTSRFSAGISIIR